MTQKQVEKTLSGGPFYLKNIYTEYMADFSAFGKCFGFGYSHPSIVPYEKLTMFFEDDYLIHIIHDAREGNHEYSFEVSIEDPHDDFSYVFKKRLRNKNWLNSKALISDVLIQASDFVARMQHAVSEYRDAIDNAVDELGNSD